MSNSGYPLNEYPTQEELISSQTPIQPQIQNPIQPQVQNPIIITPGVQTNQASQPFIVSSQQILPSNVQTINTNLISLKSFQFHVFVLYVVILDILKLLIPLILLISYVVGLLILFVGAAFNYVEVKILIVMMLFIIVRNVMLYWEVILLVK